MKFIQNEIYLSNPIENTFKFQIFNYQLIAYKESNFSWTTAFDGVIIIIDKNDQYPNFNNLTFKTEIEEEKYANLVFDFPIVCHDKDLVRVYFI